MIELQELRPTRVMSMPANNGTPSSPAEIRPETDLMQIVYVSSAAAPWPLAELNRALESFRANNERRGITGLLLHHDGNFMQAIEGPAKEIVALEQRITADPRHFGLIRLLKRPVAQREFEGWSMGFKSLSGPDFANFPGWSDFLNRQHAGLESLDTPSRAMRLLQSFRDGIRH